MSEYVPHNPYELIIRLKLLVQKKESDHSFNEFRYLELDNSSRALIEDKIGRTFHVFPNKPRTEPRQNPGKYCALHLIAHHITLCLPIYNPQKKSITIPMNSCPVALVRHTYSQIQVLDPDTIGGNSYVHRHVFPAETYVPQLDVSVQVQLGSNPLEWKNLNSEDGHAFMRWINSYGNPAH